MKFIGLKVKHNKFGEGEVIDVSPRTSELDYVFTISFDGVEKKFTLKTFNNFLTTSDEEFNTYVKDLLDKENVVKPKVEVEVKKELTPINFYNYDIKNRTLVKEHWKRMYDLAEEFRFPYHDRAIVFIKDECVYINAEVALKHQGLNPEVSELLYLACSKSTKKNASFLNYEWRYATRDDLEYIISTFNDDTDRA